MTVRAPGLSPSSEWEPLRSTEKAALVPVRELHQLQRQSATYGMGCSFAGPSPGHLARSSTPLTRRSRNLRSSALSAGFIGNKW